MIPSVTDKSLISVPNWRRHTDPPFLWIVVFISSVSLHLLIFWFLRSSDEFQPWIPRSDQAAIPVDLIDISPQVKSTSQPKLTAKTLTPKLSPSPQKSVTASLPKIAPTTPKTQDDGAINSDFNLPQSESRNTEVNNQVGDPVSTPSPTVQVTPTNIPPQTVPSPTPTPSPTIQVTPTPTQTVPLSTPIPITTPTQTIPLEDLPWNRRQEVKLGQGTPLPSDISSDSPNPTPEDSPTPTPETSPTPTSETSPTPTSETSPTPTSETSPTPTSETSPNPKVGIAIAYFTPILKDEVIQLGKQNRINDEGLPDVLAAYQGSSNKELEISLLPGDSGLKPANILASLIIDDNGNFQGAKVIEIEPTTLSSEKSTYEQALNDLFQQESFLAAHNLDGSKPGLSNLYMRIKIEPTDSP